MAGCTELTFSKVTVPVFKCCVATAAKYGVKISSDSGTASENGFKVKWNYDRAGEKLSIQCIDKPFWAPCKTVNSTIQDAIDKCRNGG